MSSRREGVVANLKALTQEELKELSLRFLDYSVDSPTALVEKQKVEMKAVLARHSAVNVEIQELQVELEAFRARQAKSVRVTLDVVKRLAQDATAIEIQMEAVIEEQKVEMKALLARHSAENVEMEALCARQAKSADSEDPPSPKRQKTS